MTTGEPLIVRCAMKPLPTLTKPLRSVDIATREPAQALRERTDSVVVPAAGVVGEAMLAIVLAGAYRQKFGGDHIDDVRAALAAYEERIGWKRRLAVGGRALVFIGFMGAGKTTAARAAAAALGARAVDSDQLLEERLGQRIEDYFAAHGEAAFRALEEEVVCELLERAARPGALARRRRRRAPSACAPRSPRHTVVLLDVDPATAWQRAGGRRAARARPRALRGAARRAPPALRRGSPTSCSTDSSRDARPPRRAGDRRAAGPGTRMLWARSASGDYPVYVGAGRARPPRRDRAAGGRSW